MLFHTLVLAFAGLAAAQSFNNASDCCDLSPDTVPQATRDSWCQAERNTCPEICNGQVASPDGNDCDANLLTFNCTCFDMTTPNVTDFGETLPSLMCDEWVTQCVAAHPNDLDGQATCHSVVCGSRNASAAEASASSSAAAASSTSSGGASTSGSASGTASSTGATATSSGAAAAVQVGREYGTGLVGAALFALFGLAL